MDSYNEDRKFAEMRKDLREFTSIDFITLSFGRTDKDGHLIPLEPGSVFPSLKDLPAATEPEESEPDPRDTFAAFKTMNAPRMERRRIKAPKPE